MQKYFSLDGPLYRFLTLMFDLITLTLCVIVTSLPLVTIGGAFVAASGVALDLVQHKSGSVLRDYGRYFKENIKIGTVIFGVNSSVLLALMLLLKNIPLYFLKFPLLVILSLFFLINDILYPLVFIRETKLQNYYRDSFALTLNYLIYLVPSFLLTLVFILVPIFMFKLFLIWFVLGLGLLFYLKAKLWHLIFVKIELLENSEEA